MREIDSRRAVVIKSKEIKILHSCGRVNDFVPLFIESGADVLNMQQPGAYGIEEIGSRFACKTCFLTTVDIQSTLPEVMEKRCVKKGN